MSWHGTFLMLHQILPPDDQPLLAPSLCALASSIPGNFLHPTICSQPQNSFPFKKCFSTSNDPMIVVHPGSSINQVDKMPQCFLPPPLNFNGRTAFCHLTQNRIPLQSYPQCAISDLKPGPCQAALTGVVVNLQSHCSELNGVAGAEGCLKIILRDETGEILVSPRYFDPDLLHPLQN